MISLRQIKFEDVSHADGVKKQVLLRKGVIPGVTAFSRAVLKPGQETAAHTHRDMYEVFLVVEGTATFQIDSSVVECTEGDCVVVEKGESHTIRNPHKTPLVIIYFGVEDYHEAAGSA